jgi:hypothetical protein
MSGTTDEIEIQIDEAQPKLEDIQVVNAEDAQQVENSDDGGSEVEQALKKMDKSLKRERKAREEAEKYAQYVAQQANQAFAEVGDTQLHLVSNALDTVKQENNILKAHLAEANASGDYARMAEIQEAMSMNAVKLNQLEQGKREMESRPKQQNYVQPPPSRPQSADPLDDIIAAVTPTSAKWLERNRDNIKDQNDINDMFNAHNSAVNRGIKPDTDAYFRFVENRLGITGYEGESAVPSAPTPQKKSAPPSAPVTRSGNGTGTRPNVVRLSGDEREMASMMGMTEQEYALNKFALQKAGKLPN